MAVILRQLLFECQRSVPPDRDLSNLPQGGFNVVQELTLVVIDWPCFKSEAEGGQRLLGVGEVLLKLGLTIGLDVLIRVHTGNNFWTTRRVNRLAASIVSPVDGVLPGGIPVAANRQLIGGAGNHGHLLVGKEVPSRQSPTGPRPKAEITSMKPSEEG